MQVLNVASFAKRVVYTEVPPVTKDVLME